MAHTSERLTIGEEIANSVTHGIGALLSVAGLTILLLTAVGTRSVAAIVAAAVYGTTLVLLYLSSTLYHSLTHPGAKRVFRAFDHSSIYLLIAGTYTPFTLVSLQGVVGWTLFGLIWSLACAGIVLACVFLGKLQAVFTLLYVLMGWVAVAALHPLIAALGWQGFAWLMAGGVCYTGGVIFFVSRRKYAHTVWHLFVLAGSACHFWTVLRYVLHRAH